MSQMLLEDIEKKPCAFFSDYYQLQEMKIFHGVQWDVGHPRFV
jgi:hypothetical protein